MKRYKWTYYLTDPENSAVHLNPSKTSSESQFSRIFVLAMHDFLECNLYTQSLRIDAEKHRFNSQNTRYNLSFPSTVASYGSRCYAGSQLE